MVKWYYLLTVQTLSLVLIALALFLPWYSMEYAAAGTLRTRGGGVAASGEMTSVEMIDLWGDERSSQATSSPQIFNDTRTHITNSEGDHTEVPNIGRVMGLARLFGIVICVVSIADLGLLVLFLFFKGKRKRIKVGIVAVTGVLFATSATGAVIFYDRMPDAVEKDLDRTIYPHLFEAIEEDNVTYPGYDRENRERFDTSRDVVYDILYNGTEYEKSFSGTSSEHYRRGYLEGAVILDVVSVFNWGGSFGWYLTEIVVLLQLIGLVLAMILDPEARSPSVRTDPYP